MRADAVARSLRLRANERNEYVLSIQIEGLEVEAVLDTGFTDALGEIGVGLTDDHFALVESSLRGQHSVPIMVPGLAHPLVIESGLGQVSLSRLESTQIETRVVRAGVGVVGVCYFHRLPGYRISWNLQAREMRIVRRGPPA